MKSSRAKRNGYNAVETDEKCVHWVEIKLLYLDLSGVSSEG